MKIFNLAALSLLATAATAEPTLRRRTLGLEPHEEVSMNNMVKIRVINEAYQQPFGPFFVMTHNSEEKPLFKVGQNATAALAHLAENGDPSQLMDAYETSNNVGYVGRVDDHAPYFGGETLEFKVPYNHDYPYLTIASMAVNTNDCFVALN